MVENIDDFQFMDMLTDVCRLFIHYTDSRLRSVRLRTGQASIVSILGRCGQLSLKEIAEKRGISVPTTSVLVSRMERDGLVLRRPPKDGGKADDVILSPKGERICERMRKLVLEDADNILSGFTDEDKQYLLKIYNKLLEKFSISR
jgi:DNA-binding MarR family transcriptional regulator